MEFTILDLGNVSDLVRMLLMQMDPMMDRTASASEFKTVPMDESGISTGTIDKNLPYPMAANTTSYNADNERIALEPGPLTPRNNIMTRLKGEVDPEQSTGPLVGYCFMTGFMSVSIPFLRSKSILTFSYSLQRFCVIFRDFCMVWIPNR